MYQDKKAIGIKMERMPELSDVLKHKVSSAVRSDMHRITSTWAIYHVLPPFNEGYGDLGKNL